MSIDPKAVEAARQFVKQLDDPNCAFAPELMPGETELIARALLAGEGPDNGRGSMAAGGKSHVNGTEPHNCTPAARSPSPAVRDAPQGWSEAIEALESERQGYENLTHSGDNFCRATNIAKEAALHEAIKTLRALSPDPDAPKEE